MTVIYNRSSWYWIVVCWIRLQCWILRDHAVYIQVFNSYNKYIVARARINWNPITNQQDLIASFKTLTYRLDNDGSMDTIFENGDVYHNKKRWKYVSVQKQTERTLKYE